MAQASPYKTHLGWRNYVGVSVLIRGSQVPVEGTVCDVNLNGVAVLFRDTSPPDIHRGDAATIRMTASWLPRPVVTSATLSGVRKDVAGKVFEFEFDDEEVVDRQITPVLHSVFNRRRAPRVVPNNEDDTRVAFQSHGEQNPSLGTLHQVSSSGLSLTIDPDDDPGTAVGTAVGLTFFLAVKEQSVHAVAHLRCRRRDGARMILGFEFDPGATPQFQRLQGAILGYVLARAPVPLKLKENER